jgi:hypothetical protein
VGLACAARELRARAALAAALLVGALFALGAPLRAAAASRAGAAEVALASGLCWLRENSPSPGPFNQAEVAADWCVLTAPEWGAAVAYHARRAVVAARFAGADSAAGPADRAASLALARTDAEALGAALGELDARYVVVSPLMARPRSLGALPPESAFRQLAFRAPDGEPAFASVLELVRASELWITAEGRAPEPGGGPAPIGPAISIYRVKATPRSTDATGRAPQASSLR